MMMTREQPKGTRPRWVNPQRPGPGLLSHSCYVIKYHELVHEAPACSPDIIIITWPSFCHVPFFADAYR